MQVWKGMCCHIGIEEWWSEWQRHGAFVDRQKGRVWRDGCRFLGEEGTLTKWIDESNQVKTWIFAFPTLNWTGAGEKALHWGETSLTCEWASGLYRNTFMPSQRWTEFLLENSDLFSHFFPACRLLGSQALVQSGLDQQRRENGSLITQVSSSSWPAVCLCSVCMFCQTRSLYQPRAGQWGLLELEKDKPTPVLFSGVFCI